MKGFSAIGAFLQNLSILAAVILGLVVGAYYYFGGYYDDGSKLEAKIAQAKAMIQKAEVKKQETTKLLAEQSEMQRDVGILADKFQQVSSKLPINLKTQEIIDTINQLAKNSGCKIVTIKPETVLIKELYDEIPVQVEMRGAFSNLVVFIYYLANLERLTYTSDLSFVNFGSVYDGTLKLTTSVVSFRFRQPTELKPIEEKSEEGRAPKKPKGGGSV